MRTNNGFRQAVDKKDHLKREDREDFYALLFRMGQPNAQVNSTHLVRSASYFLMNFNRCNETFFCDKIVKNLMLLSGQIH